MKKHTVIMQEMKKNRIKLNEIAEQIGNKRKQETMIINSLTKNVSGTTKERISARKIARTDKAFQEIDAELLKLYVEQEELEEKSVVLSNNYHCAIIHEFVPIICEIMNKYVGKRVGEKTTDKIRNEFYERTGFRFYWSSSYFTCEMKIYNMNTDIILYVTWDDKNISHFFIEELTPEKLKYSDTYVEDVDSYVKSIREERQQLKQAIENLNSMIDKYNEKTVGNMHRYNRYYDR